MSSVGIVEPLALDLGSNSYCVCDRLKLIYNRKKTCCRVYLAIETKNTASNPPHFFLALFGTQQSLPCIVLFERFILECVN